MTDQDSGLVNIRQAFEQTLGRPLRSDEFDFSEGPIGSLYIRVDGGKLTEFTRKELDDSQNTVGPEVARKIAAALYRGDSAR